MSDLYRIDYDRLDTYLDSTRTERYVRQATSEGWLVKVEPTDRICVTHGRCMWVKDVYSCPGNAVDSDDVCKIFDVVRIRHRQ